MIKNQLKTVVLLAGLTAILLWIGSFWGQTGLTIAIIFAGLMNFGSYWFSDKIVLKMYKAIEIHEKDNKQLFQMVKQLSEKSGIPTPRVYIIPSKQPNAFATGRNPKNAAVAFTQGILELLDKNELEGVTAHELAHVKNRDILIQSIASMIAGVISYIATMAQWMAIFGMGGDDDGRSSLLHLLVLIIITPIAATIIQLAISRSREYMADETGAKTVRNGSGLASALKKLEAYSKRVPMRMGTEATASMFIVNPFAGMALNKVFSTHPSTEERVKRLERLEL